jgi:hypothetical protein
MDVEVSIYLATRTRWAHLTKVVSLPAMPRVGEVIKFRNREMGDYFGFEITSVTYREGGGIEVVTGLLDNVEDRLYSFEEEQELDEYVISYLAEGWKCQRGIGPNNRLLGKPASQRVPDGA